LPRYLGLNLAWAPRNSSGGAVIEANPDGSVKLVSTTSLRSHEDILAWIARNRGRAGAVLAVNAPLIVENSSGPRPCDNLLIDHFAQYQIDDYQANIVNASHPRTIGRALMRMGFDPDPGAPGDRVFETYNRPTQILLWNLERPIRLKTGPVGARKDAVSRFREMFWDKLSDASPPLEMSPALQRLLRADLPSSNGSRVGELEDRLEAALSAYSAAYLALRGLDDCALLGDLESGYILLPTSRYPSDDPNEEDDEFLDGDEYVDEVIYEGEDGEEYVEEIVYEDEEGEYEDEDESADESEEGEYEDEDESADEDESEEAS
jgi:predicted RNase H-like nuclease